MKIVIKVIIKIKKTDENSFVLYKYDKDFFKTS